MSKIIRRKSRIIKIGSVAIGGNKPVAIQSMAKIRTSDIEATVMQIKSLEAAGCDIVRLAIKDDSDAKAIAKIKHKVNIPIVADIHFNWQLALTAIGSGADKIRLNPGNIYKKQEVYQIAKAAKSARIPIRIGLNSGSLRKHGNIADLMVKSALDYIKILEKSGFYDIVVSLKASNILDTVCAYRKISKLCGYPLHLGVTATGTPYSGAIKSAIALGALLMDGIGDTIRVSLTDNPENEVKTAKIMLEALGLKKSGPQIISCPTCGRCEVDLIKMAKELDSLLAGLTDKPLKIALMGCVVNGPGEAKEADIGIAFGRKEGLLFKKGKPVKKVSAVRCVDVLLEEIKKNVLVK